jgi:hypothetical protein
MSIESDPSLIDTALRPRLLSAENPNGERGRGGMVGNGRKGSPAIWLEPETTSTIADIDGPGTLRHCWFTIPQMAPQFMRAVAIHVYYDGRPEPSISVPLLDFCGLALGRPAHYESALTMSPEGRGFINVMPMPFRRHIRIEITNSSKARIRLYYQLTYTEQDHLPEAAGYLHALFRRENPTTLRRDYVILEGLKGPGRYLGAVIGINVIDGGSWYGEGEVKIYLDGDKDYPTICSTGLEDYVGTGWGMGVHHTRYAGVPVIVKPPEGQQNMPDVVSFYRWHVVDPMVFESACRVTIQQIGAHRFRAGQEEDLKRYLETNPPATAIEARGDFIASGLWERVDDYCSTAFAYCRGPQAVPRLDAALATAGIQRRPYEPADPAEARLAALLGQ